MSNHEIGAVLTLRDNMSATLRGVRKEQESFRKDVLSTRRELDKAFNKRLDTTAATQSIKAVRAAIEPLRNKIVTRIAIRDNATRDLRRVQNEAKALARSAISPVVKVKDAASSVIGGINSKLAALKAAAVVPLMIGSAAVAGGALAVKSGAELEQQQVSMKHFVGINNQGKSAAEIAGITANYMQSLRDNANATPFTTSDVIGAGSRALGVAGGNTNDAMELIKVAEDMAALTPGKTIGDAMEALADAKNGEMERLKEFNAKVSANEFNALGFKGIVDTRLKSQFAGGASELSTTGVGLMSTIRGKTGTLLQDSGIKMLERLKPAMTSVISMIDRYSPQMEQFGLKVADGIGFVVSKLPTLKQYLSEAFESARPALNWLNTTGLPGARGLIVEVVGEVKETYKFIKDNWTLIAPIVGGVTAAFVTYRAATLAVAAAHGVVKTVQLAVAASTAALNLVMAASPMGLLVLGMGLVVAGGIALYQHFDMLKQGASDAWVTIENAFKTGVNVAIGLINDFIGVIRKIPGLGGTPLVAKLEMSKTTREQIDYARNSYTDNWAINGSHANGLNYVPFDGYIAELHKGERVQRASENPYNHASGKSSVRGSSRVVIQMNGTVIREEADIDRLANKLAIKLDEVAANM